MIKYFATLIRGDATCKKKNSKTYLRSLWWPLSIKTPVLGKDRDRVSFPPWFNLLKKTKNVLAFKKKEFSFFAFLKSFSV